MKEIPLHERGEMPLPGWWLRRKLNHAIRQFETVLQSHPDNWASMWFVGMIYRRFRDNAMALAWFERAYQVNPSNPDVAREGSMCAMEIGKHDTSTALAWRACQIKPEDSGLRSNLALAFLLSGHLKEADETIRLSLEQAPADKISQTVSAMIDHFSSTNTVPPTTTPALLAYWKKNRPR